MMHFCQVFSDQEICLLWWFSAEFEQHRLWVSAFSALLAVNTDPGRDKKRPHLSPLAVNLRSQVTKIWSEIWGTEILEKGPGKDMKRDRRTCWCSEQLNEWQAFIITNHYRTGVRHDQSDLVWWFQRRDFRVGVQETVGRGGQMRCWEFENVRLTPGKTQVERDSVCSATEEQELEFRQRNKRGVGGQSFL